MVALPQVEPEVVGDVVLPRRVGGRWRASDLDAWEYDTAQVEVVEGEVVVNAAPNRRHQVVVGDLYARLRDAMPPGLEVLVAPYEVRTPAGDGLQPDVLVVAEGGDPRRRYETDPPLLVVEVLGDTGRTRDLVTKRRLYAELGVPTYWVVDPDEPWLLEVDLSTDVETRHDGPGPHRLQQPFEVDVRLG